MKCLPGQLLVHFVPSRHTLLGCPCFARPVVHLVTGFSPSTMKSAHTSNPDSRNYLVTLPAQLNFPSTQKICLDLSPGYYDIKFTITLKTRDKTQKLLEHHGLKKRHLHCISFLVSTDVAPPKPFISLLSSLGIHCNRTLSMFTVILLL